MMTTTSDTGRSSRTVASRVYALPVTSAGIAFS